MPAPGQYNVEKIETLVHEKAPAYSFGLKYKDRKADDIPAPGQYDVEKVEKIVHENSPAFSFGLKYKDFKTDDIPAPGQYDVEKVEKTVLQTSPAFSFGVKHKDQKPDDIPAPNSYHIPETIGGHDSTHYQAPSFTIGGKEGDIWTTNKNPGPGSYNVPEADKVKQKSPAYSLSYRTNVPKDKSKKPGPGAHCPEKVVMQHSPAFSFGIRHSPFAHQYQKDASVRNTNRTVVEKIHTKSDRYVNKKR
ncbi:Outer dense fiber protein 3-B, partial [Stegodyphus mimosarum]